MQESIDSLRQRQLVSMQDALQEVVQEVQEVMWPFLLLV